MPTSKPLAPVPLDRSFLGDLRSAPFLKTSDPIESEYDSIKPSHAAGARVCHLVSDLTCPVERFVGLVGCIRIVLTPGGLWYE